MTSRREKAIAWARGVGDPGASLLAAAGLQEELVVVDGAQAEQRLRAFIEALGPAPDVPDIELTAEDYAAFSMADE